MTDKAHPYTGIEVTDAKELPYVVWWQGRIERFCRTYEEAERFLRRLAAIGSKGQPPRFTLLGTLR